MAIACEKSVQKAMEGWHAAPANPLVGTWRLISCTARRRNGRLIPLYGPEPEGRLFYDAAGNMSVQIMRPGRRCFRAAQRSRATDDELRAAYQGYEAYFSSYEVDEARRLIRHHVRGGLFPNWTGSVQERYYRFDGPDRLILSTGPQDAQPGGRAVVTLVWERIG